MRKTYSTTALAAALAAIDFGESNAEIDRLEAERSSANAKAEEAEAEALRLIEKIQNWNGPDAEALADQLLAGASAAEVAASAPTKEQLVERRLNLLATAGALRERGDRARRDRDEVATSQSLAIAEAASEFVEAMVDRQREAARAIMDADAAIQCIKSLCGCYIAGEPASARARKGVSGMDSLLGHIDRVTVPAEVVAALKPLETRATGLRSSVPVTVANT